jgi:lipoate-protein ligase A
LYHKLRKLKLLLILLKPVSAESSENKIRHFIDTGYKSGRYNMDYDLQLVERCRNENASFLRIYGWKPYAISLGYNQNKSPKDLPINYARCKKDGLDVVQRPTGGRAVLHSQELTYSVVFKSNKPIREIYKEISLAVMKGIKLIEPSSKKLQQLSFTKKTPDLLSLVKTGMYNVCFNAAVANEINLDGKKLVGSAQRKFGNIVLQHGSILIGEHHKDIVRYLKIPDEKQALKMIEELDEKTICLEQILGRKVTFEETGKAIFRGFEKTLGIKFKLINRLADLIAKRAVPVEHILN